MSAPVVCPPTMPVSHVPAPVQTPSPFGGLALEDLFAPHTDGGRHAVCRVCKALVSPSRTARCFHMLEFHRVDMSQSA
ncbi:hypothetical protein AURDEDRAFT_117605 [Auricularia subglabra TFB-10046 SS5]|nr:hypothetical protein AURDEDRAFT_117605 [Auricularia subglabra TFB-10046 SS5]